MTLCFLTLPLLVPHDMHLCILLAIVAQLKKNVYVVTSHSALCVATFVTVLLSAGVATGPLHPSCWTSSRMASCRPCRWCCRSLWYSSCASRDLEATRSASFTSCATPTATAGWQIWRRILTRTKLLSRVEREGMTYRRVSITALLLHLHLNLQLRPP